MFNSLDTCFKCSINATFTFQKVPIVGGTVPPSTARSFCSLAEDIKLSHKCVPSSFYHYDKKELFVVFAPPQKKRENKINE